MRPLSGEEQSEPAASSGSQPALAPHALLLLGCCRLKEKRQKQPGWPMTSEGEDTAAALSDTIQAGLLLQV